MTKATITFFICLGCYFVGLGVYCLIKKIRAKRHYKKVEKQNENNEHKD